MATKTKARKEAVAAEAAKPQATAVATPAAPARSMDDRLSGEVSKKEKKSNVPSVRLPDKLATKVTQYVEAVKKIKDATAIRDAASADIAPVAEGMRLEYSRKAGTVASSLKLNDTITFVVPDVYTKLDADANKLDALKKLFGDAMFAEYFKTDYKLELAEKLTDPLIDELEKVAAKFGKRLGEMFKIGKVLDIQPKFTADRVLKPEVCALFDEAIKNGLFGAKAPSLKVE